MLFEREAGGGFLAPPNYPSEALASFNTHDLPSFRGWLEGHDLRVKHTIGVAAGESEQGRTHSQAALRAALAQWAPTYKPDDVAALASFLAATPCRLAAIAIVDIVGVRDQINIPATTTQHPNWRRKLPLAIEDMDEYGDLQRVAQAFAQAGRSFKA